jgi:hypothetical protein
VKPEIKARWLAALRSGEYVQGHEALRAFSCPPFGGAEDVTEVYCCLGVLCDLAARDGVVEWDGIDVHYTDPQRGREHWENNVLPLPVMVWAGLAEDNPRVACEVGGYTSANLATLNDSHGLDFSELADCIEESL